MEIESHSGRRKNEQQLLTEKIIAGYSLLDVSCPNCLTALVKSSSSETPEKVNKNTYPRSRAHPVSGVPFCVLCSSHVVTSEEEISILSELDATGEMSGSILVATDLADSNGTKASPPLRGPINVTNSSKVSSQDVLPKPEGEAEINDDVTQDYDAKREIATKALGKKMMQGFIIRDTVCMKCFMPMMEEPSSAELVCVVCPTLAKKARKKMKGRSVQPKHTTVNNVEVKGTDVADGLEKRLIQPKHTMVHNAEGKSTEVVDSLNGRSDQPNHSRVNNMRDSKRTKVPEDFNGKNADYSSLTKVEHVNHIAQDSTKDSPTILGMVQESYRMSTENYNVKDDKKVINKQQNTKNLQTQEKLIGNKENVEQKRQEYEQEKEKDLKLADENENRVLEQYENDTNESFEEKLKEEIRVTEEKYKRNNQRILEMRLNLEKESHAKEKLADERLETRRRDTDKLSKIKLEALHMRKSAEYIVENRLLQIREDTISLESDSQMEDAKSHLKKETDELLERKNNLLKEVELAEADRIHCENKIFIAEQALNDAIVKRKEANHVVKQAEAMPGHRWEIAEMTRLTKQNHIAAKAKFDAAERDLDVAEKQVKVALEAQNTGERMIMNRVNESIEKFNKEEERVEAANASKIKVLKCEESDLLKIQEQYVQDRAREEAKNAVFGHAVHADLIPDDAIKEEIKRHLSLIEHFSDICKNGLELVRGKTMIVPLDAKSNTSSDEIETQLIEIKSENEDNDRAAWEQRIIEGRMIMGEKLINNWIMTTNTCSGKECKNTPILTKDAEHFCVVCRGSGNGEDGAYENSHQDTLPNSVKELDFESKRNIVSREICKRMLDGWKLLDFPCPFCTMPLMSQKDHDDEICIICGPVESDSGAEKKDENFQQDGIQTKPVSTPDSHEAKTENGSLDMRLKLLTEKLEFEKERAAEWKAIAEQQKETNSKISSVVKMKDIEEIIDSSSDEAQSTATMSITFDVPVDIDLNDENVMRELVKKAAQKSQQRATSSLTDRVQSKTPSIDTDHGRSELIGMQIGGTPSTSHHPLLLSRPKPGMSPVNQSSSYEMSPLHSRPKPGTSFNVQSPGSVNSSRSMNSFSGSVTRSVTSLKKIPPRPAILSTSSPSLQDDSPLRNTEHNSGKKRHTRKSINKIPRTFDDDSSIQSDDISISSTALNTILTKINCVQDRLSHSLNKKDADIDDINGETSMAKLLESLASAALAVKKLDDL
eukprot:CAMPEP_0184859864 /NCGR_PEP_ID=MMETSP0580-20130426/4834_1 /TAXON_ID=1118495 /ORGANISM="Dactyliosolen fragilissimus" /LENGTH=1227 /DNA_ID=CAMNT_0027356717 /DNA_START=26 /DNA_END=3709 /DNA_ORIENTATION=-